MQTSRKLTSSAITSGFVAWLLMTIWVYTGRYLGLPKLDIAKFIGGAITRTMPPLVPWMSADWWYGMVIHFVLGTVIFSMIFLYVVYPLTGKSPLLAGLLWGLVLWLVMETLVLHLMGIGIFAPRLEMHRFWWAAEVLIAHGIYGIVLGFLFGRMAGVPHTVVATAPTTAATGAIS